jgi:sulfoxide reductase heme-binding subunit YedZ
VDLGAIVADIVKRPFILVGFLALLILLPMAITSTNAMVRRLGYARWQRLHRLVYVAAGLACLHFFWRVKKDHTQPAVYASVLAGLLFIRVALWLRARYSNT